MFIAVVFVLVSVLSGCNEPADYSYEPNSDFFNILTMPVDGKGTNSRAFSFATLAEKAYTGCEVQLDPAEANETEPQFGAEDNISIPATAYPSTAFGMFFLDTSKTLHKAYTDSLEADSKYFYRVGSAERKSWSDWSVINTDDGDGSFSFIHISDTQPDADDEFAAVSQIMRKVYEGNKDSEFVLATGDLLEFGVAQDKFDRYLDGMKHITKEIPFIPVIGNHEIFTDIMRANFYLPMDGRESFYYAYEYGDCLFMVFDNNTMDYEPQLTWMSSVIEKSTAKWRIIASHFSSYSTGTHADDGNILRFKNSITPFAASNSVALVLSGHDHIYARTCPIDADGSRDETVQTTVVEQDGYQKTVYTNPNGTVYVSIRAAGTKFYGKTKSLNDHLIDKGDPYKIEVSAFGRVEINGDRLTYTTYEFDRATEQTSVYDCFEIVR